MYAPSFIISTQACRWTLTTLEPPYISEWARIACFLIPNSLIRRPHSTTNCSSDRPLLRRLQAPSAAHPSARRLCTAPRAECLTTEMMTSPRRLTGLLGLQPYCSSVRIPSTGALGSISLGRTSKMTLFATQQFWSNNFYEKSFSCKVLDLVKKNSCKIESFLVGIPVVEVRWVKRRDFFMFGWELRIIEPCQWMG